MEYELFDLIVKSASRGLTLQKNDGSFPKGHDGPWNYEDTFLRTTSHWAILMSKAYELTNEKKYLLAVGKACNFLISKEARPYNYTFFCRKNNPFKDKCNGLIGQAWVLEALILVGQQLNEENYLNAAKNVLQLHPYDSNKHSWSVVEIDGTVLGECMTLNQQIWFTSMVVTLGNILNDNFLLTVGIDFFSQLHKKIAITDEGIIKHSYLQDRWRIRKWGRQLLSQININGHNSQQKTLSISYLPFLLYGIASVIDKSPNRQILDIMKKNFFAKAVRYIESNFPYGYLENPDSYRWSYNPVGIEMAYILQVLSQKNDLNSDKSENFLTEEKITKWLSRQIEGYYDFNENLLSKHTTDPNILAARFYEAVRLKNYKIVLNTPN